MKTSTIEAASRSSLSSKAYFLIRERILRGHLRPGDVSGAASTGKR
jgi:DNA-binding GntR family transcriptional regulator